MSSMTRADVCSSFPTSRLFIALKQEKTVTGLKYFDLPKNCHLRQSSISLLHPSTHRAMVDCNSFNSVSNPSAEPMSSSTAARCFSLFVSGDKVVAFKALLSIAACMNPLEYLLPAPGVVLLLAAHSTRVAVGEIPERRSRQCLPNSLWLHLQLFVAALEILADRKAGFGPTASPVFEQVYRSPLE